MIVKRSRSSPCPTIIPQSNSKYVSEHTSSTEMTSSLSLPGVHVKRGSGCTEINATTFDTGGVIFNIFCDTSWSWTGQLSVTYTSDFQTCISECVTWNTKMSSTCIGVRWSSGVYGPSGLSGGSVCFFFWEMFQGGESSDVGTDSARMVNAVVVMLNPVIDDRLNCRHISLASNT